MRRFSTRIGVYAILLIAAFHGSFSVISRTKKTEPDAALITRQAAVSAEKKIPTTTENFPLRKIENLFAGYSASLQPNVLTAGAKQGFFNYSDTINTP